MEKLKPGLLKQVESENLKYYNEMVDKPANLMQSLIIECTRVGEIIKAYEDPKLNGSGALAALLMREAVEKAEKARHSFDTVAMLQAFHELKGFEL